MIETLHTCGDGL
jgi:hypothetical protein